MGASSRATPGTPHARPIRATDRHSVTTPGRQRRGAVVKHISIATFYTPTPASVFIHDSDIYCQFANDTSVGKIYSVRAERFQVLFGPQNLVRPTSGDASLVLTQLGLLRFVVCWICRLRLESRAPTKTGIKRVAASRKPCLSVPQFLDPGANISAAPAREGRHVCFNHVEDWEHVCFALPFNLRGPCAR
jgi:hypothetical protein